jgi:hypothetical protein
MKPVFLDTVGRLASCDGSDQWHPLARPVLDRLMRDRRSPMTTTFVMLTNDHHFTAAGFVCLF